MAVPSTDLKGILKLPQSACSRRPAVLLPTRPPKVASIVRRKTPYPFTVSQDDGPSEDAGIPFDDPSRQTSPDDPAPQEPPDHGAVTFEPPYSPSEPDETSEAPGARPRKSGRTTDPQPAEQTRRDGRGNHSRRPSAGSIRGSGRSPARPVDSSPNKPTNQWKVPFAAELGSGNTSVLAAFLPSILFSKTKYRLQQVKGGLDAFDMSHFSIFNDTCLCHVFTCGLITGEVRTEVREQYDIEGSHGTDCLVGALCQCCTVLQNDLEVQTREKARILEDAKKKKAAGGIVSDEPSIRGSMQYTPNTPNEPSEPVELELELLEPVSTASIAEPSRQPTSRRPAREKKPSTTLTVPARRRFRVQIPPEGLETGTPRDESPVYRVDASGSELISPAPKSRHSAPSFVQNDESQPEPDAEARTQIVPDQQDTYPRDTAPQDGNPMNENIQRPDERAPGEAAPDASRPEEPNDHPLEEDDYIPAGYAIPAETATPFMHPLDADTTVDTTDPPNQEHFLDELPSPTQQPARSYTHDVRADEPIVLLPPPYDEHRLSADEPVYYYPPRSAAGPARTHTLGADEWHGATAQRAPSHRIPDYTYDDDDDTDNPAPPPGSSSAAAEHGLAEDAPVAAAAAALTDHGLHEEGYMMQQHPAADGDSDEDEDEVVIRARSPPPGAYPPTPLPGVPAAAWPPGTPTPQPLPEQAGPAPPAAAQAQDDGGDGKAAARGFGALFARRQNRAGAGQMDGPWMSVAGLQTVREAGDEMDEGDGAGLRGFAEGTECGGGGGGRGEGEGGVEGKDGNENGEELGVGGGFRPVIVRGIGRARDMAGA